MFSLSKPTAVLLAASLVFFSFGCFTGLLSDNYKKSPIKSYSPKHSDSILAIGQPDTSLQRQLNNDDTLFFIGTKNTYLLYEGGKLLLKISTQLDGKNISLNFESYNLYIKNDKIWGSFKIIYSNTNISANEITKLDELGFTVIPSESTTYPKSYIKQVAVCGMVMPAIILSKESAHKFKLERNINFYEPPKSAIIPNIKTTALMPFAIAADIVTSPFQILFVIIVSKTGRP